ncbi:MAG: hypothetical protein E7173_01810 [Firmicutes bacterium]|nr:hypothetical protein [Bacillota bacterium]
MFKIAKRYTFADSGAITYAIFFKHLDSPEMAELVDKQLEEAEVIFVCDNEFEFVIDGIRESDPEVYKNLQKDLIAFFKRRNIPFVMLSGSIEKSFRTVEEILKKYETKKK